MNPPIIETPFAPALAAGLVLVSWYKPLLWLTTLSVWAWIVSTIYDKDAGRWYLPREMWSYIHIAAGALAIAALLAPFTFWIAWPVAAAILIADLLAYALYRNADKRVPPTAKWTLNLAEMRERAEARKAEKQARSINYEIKGPNGPLPPPDRDEPEYEVRVWCEELIESLIESRGVQLDITPTGENQYALTFLVDGVRKPVERMHANKAVAIADFYKQAAALDVSDRRRRQVGDFTIAKPGGSPTTARVTTQGSSKGIHCSLVLNPAQQVSRRLDDLGFHKNQLQDARKIIDDHAGVVLLAGTSDGGRTSTLYAFLREHDAYTSNVQSIEIDVDAELEGIRQNKFTPGGDAEYATTVRSILRRDPDVVGIAEMADEATAKEVARSDHERTRAYLSIRAEGALQAIQLYARAVGDQKLAATSLHGVIAQRLVRQLCMNCRTPFTPKPEDLKKLGLPPNTKQLYRKSGQVLHRDKPQTCPVCNGDGFFGQVGVFEVHPVDQTQRKLIAANDLSGLRATWREAKQQSLQQAGLQHVVEGNTAVEEVIRMVQGSKTKKKAPSKGGPSQRPAAPAG